MTNSFRKMAYWEAYKIGVLYGIVLWTGFYLAVRIFGWETFSFITLPVACVMVLVLANVLCRLMERK